MNNNNSWDFFGLQDRCDIAYCSLVVLILSIVCALFLLFIFCLIRHRIHRFHRIQIKKAPQRNASEISIFPNKKTDIKALNPLDIAKAKKCKKGKSQKAEKHEKPEKHEKGEKAGKALKGEKKYKEAKQKQAKKDQIIDRKRKDTSMSVSERPSNKINNFIDEPKQILSENLRVEYFEDRDANTNTDITTIPKERRLAGNVSGLDFLNFSNTGGDLSEKNFENFMKLKNKKRMFNNDDSIEFEDVDNIDMNHSEKGSFRIENKLEIKHDEEFINECEPKITRNSEPLDNHDGENYIGNVLRDLENEGGGNPYLEEGFQVRNLIEVEDEKEKKNDGLEVVREVNEESDRENKR